MSVLAYTLLSLWLFWCLYVFTMGLYRAFLLGRLKGFSLVLASPVVVLALAVDVLMQLTLFVLVFVELPRDWLVTHRLRRYLRDLPADNWRHRWARSLCHHLLDPFDPTGAHCDDARPEYRPVLPWHRGAA